MNPSKLKESEKTELKESFKDDAMKTLCAFANTKGGSLFVGVKNDSTLLGGKISDKAQQNYVNQIVSLLGIQPEMIVHKDGNDEFLEIKVSKSKTPVDIRGRFYKRVGNTTREIDRDGLKSFLLKDVPWDSQIRENRTFDNLNDLLIVQIALQYFQSQDPDFRGDVDTKEFCQHLGLVKDDKLTNAALILFGKNVYQTFPFAKIRIGRFKDDTTIISDHEVTGNLIVQLREAEKIIRSHLNKRYIISGDSFQRQEVWDYPLESIREAVLNAIVHRNYHIANAEIQIKIYDDFLWIYSPGKLPEEITIEQLKKPHSSIRRNPLIANLFFRAGYIEQFGSGTLRMTKELVEAGHPEPTFTEEGNGFVVRFDKTLEPVEFDPSELNDRQLTAITMAELEEIQAADLQNEFPDVARKTITRDLTELVEKEIFDKTGKGKGTRYRLRFKH